MKKLSRVTLVLLFGLFMAAPAFAGGDCAMAHAGCAKDCSKSCCAGKKDKKNCPAHPDGKCDCKHGPTQNFGPKNRS